MIAVIGGGLSGSLTAYHLARKQAQVRVVLIEPRATPGAGLSYFTQSSEHVLNVPAGKISALADEPEHFLCWLHRHGNAEATADDFVPRAVFGRYLQSLLEGVPGIEHRRTCAIHCRVEGERAVVGLADGSELYAEAVVLATGNFEPAQLPGVADEAIASGVYCNSAWQDACFRGLDPNAPVALVGSGLTAVDALLRLREVGHRGLVTLISRHGRLPHRHAPYRALPQAAIAGEAPRRARDLLRMVHFSLKSGAEWRAVIDSLRPRSNELWQALPVAEQRRFRRHLQHRWDVARHRMAGRVADRIEAELAAGTLVRRRGCVQAVLAAADGARLQIRSSGGEVGELVAARVINCTGPNMNYRRAGSPLLESLFAQGLALCGPLGSGLWTDGNGALRAEDGSFSRILFHVGPGRQGTLFESNAVPELRVQAQEMALLLTQLGSG